MMIEIRWEDSFTKKVKKIIKSDPSFKSKLVEQLQLFAVNQFDPTLKTHKLHGKLKNYWAFSVDYNYRIIFIFNDDSSVSLINIGDHDEVY